MDRFAVTACRTALVLFALCAPAAAQFNSGSSGANGTFPPLPSGATAVPDETQYLVWNMSTGLVRYCKTYDTTQQPETCTEERGTGQIPGIPQGGSTTGTFHFAAVDIRPAPTPGTLDIYLVGNANNSPLAILSQDSIRIGRFVTLHAEGRPGASSGLNLQPNQSYPGGRPGPGGFAGGSSGITTTSASDGNPGFGPAGGAGGIAASSCPDGGISQTPPNSAQSLPLLGGSGGGGAGSSMGCAPGKNNGGGGGGGGGAVLMAATNQIVFETNASLYLFGGDSGFAACPCFDGGPGSGGNLRLVATTLVADGSASAYFYGGRTRNFVRAPGGSVSIEGDTRQFSMTLTSQRSTNIVATPGAVTPAATPTLRITSIGSLTVPAAPTGNAATPDVTFPTPPTEPVTVTIQASNIPIGTSAKVRVTPQVGSFTEVTSSALIGTAVSSTATASVTIPPGYGAITASATFSCDGTICMILPPQDRAGAVVEVVADGAGSRAVIVKADGTRIALPSAHD